MIQPKTQPWTPYRERIEEYLAAFDHLAKEGKESRIMAGLLLHVTAQEVGYLHCLEALAPKLEALENCIRKLVEVRSALIASGRVAGWPDAFAGELVRGVSVTLAKAQEATDA